MLLMTQTPSSFSLSIQNVAVDYRCVQEVVKCSPPPFHSAMGKSIVGEKLVFPINTTHVLVVGSRFYNAAAHFALLFPLGLSGLLLASWHIQKKGKSPW